MINYITVKYYLLKDYIYADRLNMFEFTSSVITLIGIIAMAVFFNRSDVAFLIGGLLLVLGLALDGMVYVVEEIRIASPIWKEAYEEAAKVAEEKEDDENPN